MPRPLPPPLPEAQEEKEPEAESGFSYDSVKANALTLPIAMAIAWLTHALFITRFFLGFFSLQFHELGHAMHAWMLSRFAMPLFYGETIWHLKRSLGVYVLLIAAEAVTAYWSFRENKFFLPFVCACLFFVQTRLLSADQTTAEMWMVFGGVAGEFYLSTFLVVASFYQLPPVLRWDFWRFPALGVGTYVFWDSYSFWLDVARGRKQLPLGTLLQGAKDNHGDMNRLIHPFGWTEQSITHAYLSIGHVCLAIVIAHYIFFLVQSFFKASRGSSPVIS
jgi:hypothetical protein